MASSVCSFHTVCFRIWRNDLMSIVTRTILKKVFNPPWGSSRPLMLRAVPIVTCREFQRAWADTTLKHVQIPMLREVHLGTGKSRVFYRANPVWPMPGSRQCSVPPCVILWEVHQNPVTQSELCPSCLTVVILLVPRL